MFQKYEKFGISVSDFFQAQNSTFQFKSFDMNSSFSPVEKQQHLGLIACNVPCAAAGPKPLVFVGSVWMSVCVRVCDGPRKSSGAERGISKP